MLQLHSNRRTVAFLSFFDNGNVALWPRVAFELDDSMQLYRICVDMLHQLGMPLFRTIVGENETLTMQALRDSGWQHDGIWRHVARSQTGAYIDGMIFSFDGQLPQIPLPLSQDVTPKEDDDGQLFRQPQT